VAAEFDGVHSIQRAVQVGSVDAIVRPEELRPQIIAAVERGLARAAGAASAVTPAVDGPGAGVRAAGDLVGALLRGRRRRVQVRGPGEGRAGRAEP